MDYKTPLIQQAINDLNKLVGTLKKYEKAADKEIKNAHNNIPKAERKPFVEALKSQQEQVENVTKRAQEEIKNVVDRLS